jgi:hypothetical protein
MKPFDLSVLFLPGAVIWLLTFAVSLRITRDATTSFAAALIKTAVFLVYFGLVFDGTFTFLDDWSYLEGGTELMQQGVGVWSAPEHWGLLVTIGGGDHFLYYVFNAYALRLFGEGYFAPVACNVLLTIAVAAVGSRLAQSELHLPRRQARWFYVFLLLHPDILAWSTVMNGKDIAALLMHVLLLQAVALFHRGQRRQAALIAVLVTLVLTFMRFYVPFIFLAALVLGSLLMHSQRGHLGRLLVAGLLFGAAVLALDAQIDYALEVAKDTFVNPLFGFLRVVLTPIPFHTSIEYTFLDAPALIHWFLMPFAVLGFATLWRLGTPFARFFVAYLLLFLCLYAVVGELQGPRQRVQLDYAVALLQFVGFLCAARALHAIKVADRGPALGEVVGPA